MIWPNAPWAKVQPRQEGGWRIVIPVRREEVAVEKRTEVYEEIEVRREMIEGLPQGLPD